ncbi:MAG: glycogen-binding domain-containing protein [Paludibacteraceae bacterium]|nr:glycogen-binding domain-containing protein [Paludibacteraceae bacterium]
MKKVKFLFMAFVAVAMTLASCSKDEPTTPVVPVDPPKGLEEQPVIAAPAAGQVTIAMRIPAGTDCYGVSFRSATGGTIHIAEKVSKTKTWYSVTVDLADAKGKGCLLLKDSTVNTNWTTQWSKTDLVVLEGSGAELIDDFGKALSCSEGGVVVYVSIDSWQEVPCTPDTKYSLTVTVPECTPSDAIVYVIGSFKESAWEKAIPLVKQPNGTFTGTISGQPGAEYKYRLTESDWSGEEKIIKSEELETELEITMENKPNRVLAASANVADEVEIWATCDLESMLLEE